jgi:hypothetical protein
VSTPARCARSRFPGRTARPHVRLRGAKSSRYYDAGGAALSFYSLDLDIDQRTGLPSASRDTAGIQTNLEYDAIGRPRWRKPATGHGAWVETTYTVASPPGVKAEVKVYWRPNGSTSGVLAREAFKYEDFGRLAIEHRLLYDGTWNQRLSEYNAMGWKTSLSEWQLNGTSGGDIRRTVFSGFDSFGRPTTITSPDGFSHNVTLAYLGTRQVTRTVKVNQSSGEAGATTTEEYDRQGRLWRVTEPSGSGGASVTSTYSYDVGNRLTQASTVSGGTTQNRIFTYDRRGFLTSEQLPEKGASGNGSVTYSNYDARGHAGRVVDGPND